MPRFLVSLTFLVILSGCGRAEYGNAYEGDAKVIQALKDAGSDVSKPHPIDFFFYGFADRASAEKFAKELSLPNWKLDVHPAPLEPGWAVTASTEMVPDLYDISVVTGKFDALAPKFGGEYDGWEAAVTK